jgi:hypothetical protein
MIFCRIPHQHALSTVLHSRPGPPINARRPSARISHKFEMPLDRSGDFRERRFPGGTSQQVDTWSAQHESDQDPSSA